MLRLAGALALFAALLSVPTACAPDADGAGPPAATDRGGPAQASPLPAPRPFEPDERAALDAWRARRDERLAAPDGYLSLVALAWLGEGEHRVGSADDARVRLPPELAPPRVGRLHVEGEGEAVQIRFTAEPGVEVTLDGAPLGPGPVALGWGAETSELAVGDLTFWIIERVGQLGVRARSPRSPLRAAFRGNATWPADGAWRLAARFRPHAEPRPYAIPNILGSEFDDTSPGVLEFEHDGAWHTLHPTGDPATGLSLIFGDASNGQRTYGGGRFLTVPPPDEDGLTWLDFNRAYNPPCAYSPYTTCPLPPPDNRLPFAVEAGELRYAADTPRVLLLTQSAGYRHAVVTRPAGGGPSPVEAALTAAGAPRFEITTSMDAATLDADTLATYDAVVLYTTGELPMPEPTALVDWVAAGGALVGVHCATDTFYEVPAYQGMLGGVFDGHPWTGPVTVTVEDGGHPATRGLGAAWELSDEIYQFREFERDAVHVLLSLDTTSVDVSRGKRADGDYALAWCRGFGEGRVFYTALGHEPALWADPVFVGHVLGGLAWALGAGAPVD